MKLRIDFSVRETDVPPEDARGIRFGDNIDAKQIFDFFNKCRDAVMTLFGQKLSQDRFAEERKRLETEIEKLKAELRAEAAKRHLERTLPAAPVRPCDSEYSPWEYRPDHKKHWMASDGSRGGDGPPTPEFIKKLMEMNDPNRNRY